MAAEIAAIGRDQIRAGFRVCSPQKLTMRAETMSVSKAGDLALLRSKWIS